MFGGATVGATTSPERALKLIAKGRARPIDEWTIEMIDASTNAEPDAGNSSRPHSSPDLGNVVEFRDCNGPGQTYLHYPQKEQGTHGKRVRRAA